MWARSAFPSGTVANLGGNTALAVAGAPPRGGTIPFAGGEIPCTGATSASCGGLPDALAPGGQLAGVCPSIKDGLAAGQGRTNEALCWLRPLRDDLVSAGRLFEATGIALDLGGLLAGQGDEAGVLELARQLEPLLEDKRIPVPARTPLKLFRWAVRRGNFQAERGHKLALEFRKAGGRLTRPYELPL